MIGAGEHDRDTVENTEQYIQVSELYQHAEFNLTGKINKDISLLKLSSRLQFNNFVRPACLKDEEVPPGTDCIASGWGHLGRCISCTEHVLLMEWGKNIFQVPHDNSR